MDARLGHTPLEVVAEHDACLRPRGQITHALGAALHHLPERSRLRFVRLAFALQAWGGSASRGFATPPSKLWLSTMPACVHAGRPRTRSALRCMASQKACDSGFLALRCMVRVSFVTK